MSILAFLARTSRPLDAAPEGRVCDSNMAERTQRLTRCQFGLYWTSSRCQGGDNAESLIAAVHLPLQAAICDSLLRRHRVDRSGIMAPFEEMWRVTSFEVARIVNKRRSFFPIDMVLGPGTACSVLYPCTCISLKIQFLARDDTATSRTQL